jgi:hypothetical protein
MSASTVPGPIARAKSGAGFKAIAIAALVVVLTAIITEAGIQASLKFGRLSIPPTYDDVVYFISAAKWLSAWPGRTLAASLHALLAEHAPFSTITAVAGFLLTPDGYVGHYAINAVVIAGFMLGIAALAWRSRFIDIAICLIGAACFPLMVQAVNEARPDLPWGLFSGLVIGAIVHTPIGRRSLPAVAVLGFACGLAGLVKPSALPASLACFAAVFLISTAAGRFDSDHVPTVRNAAWRVLVFGIGVVAALAPYLSVSFSQITAYIWKTLVENRALWALDAGLYDHAVYYSFGPVGQIALGGGLLVGLGLFAARLALAAWLKSRDLVRAVVLVSAVTVAYAIPSVSVVKSYFLGAIFYGAFVVATALNFVAIVGLLRDAIGDRSAGRGWILAAFRVVVLVALAGVFLNMMVLKDAPIASVFDQASRQEVRASSEAMWPILRGFAIDARKTLRRPLDVAFSSPFPVNPSLMLLYAEQAQIPLSARGEFFHPRLDEALKSLTSADVVIVPSSLQHNLPTPRMGDDLIRALDGRSDLCVIQTIALPNDRVLRVYRKADQGCSLPAAH